MLPVFRSQTGVISAPGPATVGPSFFSVYMPTARQIEVSDSGESNRQRQSTYSRGYKERSTIIFGPSPWMYRRIVFSLKGFALFDQTGDLPPFLDIETPIAIGMTRLMGQMPTTQYIRLRDLLFDGQEGVDWATILNAKVDTTRVTLHYDRKISLNSGNQVAATRQFKFWHPTNKTLMYDDDEAGETGLNTYVSTTSKIGMGDLYVVDYFENLLGNTETLQWGSEGTYYWHEK